MEFALSTIKHKAKSHNMIFFHNDTRIFGDWIGTHVTIREKPTGVTDRDDASSTHLSRSNPAFVNPMHRFFRDVIFGDAITASSSCPSRLRLSHLPEAVIELDIQVAGIWYQKLQLQLDGSSRWPGQDGNYVECQAYWKTRKLVLLISDKTLVSPDEANSEKMLVIGVAEDDPSQLVMSLKWTSDCIYRKVFRRVTFKEILLVDQAPQSHYGGQ